ncbi:hypothetical protein F4820DRAFT_444443 [Hypoxylon rubiginosum]|uniref:Uncharacterized protein n=1 Tax=Hypoxylon rubiginosum TaxID=110542 RepID=A0ACB9ZC05_9PEZI|nr:hypothetical protein F4820DRAFT_444443 [Hypoxylon rubiginosum]
MPYQGSTSTRSSRNEFGGSSSSFNSTLTGTTVSRPSGDETAKDLERSASAFLAECCSITINGMKFDKLTANLGTEVGFSLSFTITMSGPASNDFAITDMPVDLYGPAGRFASVVIPGVAFSPTGNGPAPADLATATTTDFAKVSFEMTDQPGRVVRRMALYSLLIYLVHQPTAPLAFRDGRARLFAEAAGFESQPVVFNQSTEIPAMDGPWVSVSEVYSGAYHRCPLLPREEYEADGSTAVVVRLRVDNRCSGDVSLAIDFGECLFDVRNAADEVLARLGGRFEITGGYSTVTLAGVACAGVPVRKGTPRLVGRVCPKFEDTWAADLLRMIELPLRDIWKLRRYLDDRAAAGSGTARRH